MSSDRPATILSPSDLFLAPALSDQSVQEYLSSLGFREPSAADQNLQLMAEDYAVRQTLGAMAESLMDSLRRAPIPTLRWWALKDIFQRAQRKSIFLITWRKISLR